MIPSRITVLSHHTIKPFGAKRISRQISCITDIFHVNQDNDSCRDEIMWQQYKWEARKGTYLIVLRNHGSVEVLFVLPPPDRRLLMSLPVATFDFPPPNHRPFHVMIPSLGWEMSFCPENCCYCCMIGGQAMVSCGMIRSSPDPRYRFEGDHSLRSDRASAALPAVTSSRGQQLMNELIMT